MNEYPCMFVPFFFFYLCDVSLGVLDVGCAESEFLETEGEVFPLDSNSFPLLPYSDSLGFTEYDPTTPSQVT
jgi:hypothetical protein